MPTLFGTNSVEVEARRRKALMEGQGYYAETFSRSAQAGATVLTSGLIVFTAIGLAGGDPVSNISTHCSVVPTTPTLTKTGLYDKNGNRLAVSADRSSDFASTGTKVAPMILTSNGTPYLVPIDDVYYVGFISVAATGASMMRGALANGGGVVGSGALNYAGQTGQSDLGTSQTIAFSSSACAMWAAIS